MATPQILGDAVPYSDAYKSSDDRGDRPKGQSRLLDGDSGDVGERRSASPPDGTLSDLHRAAGEVENARPHGRPPPRPVTLPDVDGPSLQKYSCPGGQASSIDIEGSTSCARSARAE